jgi:hypothetical protein
VKQLFEVEWLGGVTEHHFRKVRPAAEQLPWGTVEVSRYAPDAVERARASWTEVAINEYRAIASFSEVLRALVDVRAPLDLLGMTSDFLADECSHVELASRMAMELGGAVPREVDLEQFSMRPRGLTAWQRANELLLRASCISEAFSGGTAAVSCSRTTHPLPRAVYETILRDEALHRRLGGLYFEWALARIDEAELERLSRVMAKVLATMRPYWKRPAKAASIPDPPADARGRAARHRRAPLDHRHHADARGARRAVRLSASTGTSPCRSARARSRPCTPGTARTSLPRTTAGSCRRSRRS